VTYSRIRVRVLNCPTKYLVITPYSLLGVDPSRKDVELFGYSELITNAKVAGATSFPSVYNGHL